MRRAPKWVHAATPARAHMVEVGGISCGHRCVQAGKPSAQTCTRPSWSWPCWAVSVAQVVAVALIIVFDDNGGRQEARRIWTDGDAPMLGARVQHEMHRARPRVRSEADGRARGDGPVDTWQQMLYFVLIGCMCTLMDWTVIVKTEVVMIYVHADQRLRLRSHGAKGETKGLGTRVHSSLGASAIGHLLRRATSVDSETSDRRGRCNVEADSQLRLVCRRIAKTRGKRRETLASPTARGS